MNERVAHFLLTPFNVASPGREQAIRLRPGWLDERFNLFREYCIPSVASQTHQDFEWVAFFDEQMPENYRSVISELQKIYPFRAEFTALFEMDRLAPLFLNASEHAGWLLTSRLDSDDILSADHVTRLREAVKPPDRRSSTSRKGHSLRHRETSSPLRGSGRFQSFRILNREGGLEVRTIWGEKHVDIERLAPVTQIRGIPAWFQIVHGGNVSNRIKGRRQNRLLFRCLPLFKRAVSPIGRIKRWYQRRNQHHPADPPRERESLCSIAKTVYYSPVKS